MDNETVGMSAIPDAIRELSADDIDAVSGGVDFVDHLIAIFKVALGKMEIAHELK